MAKLRVGIVQLEAQRSKEESRRRILSLLARSRVEADVIAFPEYSMMDPTGVEPRVVAEAAEPLDGEWVGFAERLASEYSSYIAVTLFEATGDKPYNSVVLVSPSGSIATVYRKIHLFDAYGYRESDYFRPGGRPAEPVNVKGFNTAFAICFDIRFPELFRLYALKGADIVIVPSGWYRGPMKEETLRFLAQARAHENTVYLVVPVLYGANFTGRSMVVDPFGTVVLDAGIGERYVEACLERERVEEARRTIPVLRLRRVEAYQGIC